GERAPEGPEEGERAPRLLEPCRRIHGEQLEGRLRAEPEPAEIEPVELRHPSDRRVAGARLALDAPQDPLEHADVLAEARPEHPAVVAGPEPVDVEDARRTREHPADLEPVREVLAHVVAAEGEHPHRIVLRSAGLAARRALADHGGAHVDAVTKRT